MFIEMIDALRCPVDHEEIWLVAAINERNDRFVVGGVLGCPICAREYPVVGGVAHFGTAATAPAAEQGGDVAEGAMRIGAFLAPAEGSTVALAGEWTRYAAELAGMVAPRIYAVNPVTGVEEGELVALLTSDMGLPFAPRSLRGVALPGTADERDVRGAVRVLADGGRLVAPASIPVPPEMEELARDEQLWVGEKRSALVGLRRAR